MVRYHNQHGTTIAEYGCTRNVTNYGHLGPCQMLSGPCVDEFLTEQVLSALAPAAIEVSLRAADKVITEREQLEKLWTQRLERAAYEADRAWRFYRLVTRQLERDWETALAEQQRLRNTNDSPSPARAP